MKKISMAILLTWQLAGCGALIEHQPAALPVMPTQWQQGASGQPVANERWWEVFADAQLNALMERARVANFDVVQASLRFEQARLQTSLADRDLWPTASGSVSASVSRPIGSVPSQTSVQIGGINYTMPTGSPTVHSYSAGVQLSYEADLWSRISSSRTAARDAQSASVADIEFARLLACTAVAQHYWKLALLERQLPLHRAHLEATDELLRVQEVRWSAGKITAEEVMTLREDRQAVLADLDRVQTSRRSERYALALLVGGTPEEFELAGAELPQRPLPAIAPGLPAQLLDRRPDMRAKRLRLDATLQQLNIAEAARYPQLVLSAGASGSSTALRDLLANPYGSLGLAIGLPFLDGQRLANNRDQKKIDVDLAAADFRDKLYAALSEVELVLAKQPENAKSIERAQASLALSRQREQMMQVRVDVGARARTDLLNEQNSRRNAEMTLLQARQAELDDWVLLRKALGGF